MLCLFVALKSINDFALLGSPPKSVFRTQQGVHLHAMNTVIRAACGIAGDHHFVSSLQSRARYALTTQRGGSAPLDSPTLHDTLGVGSFNVNEGMGVSEIEF